MNIINYFYNSKLKLHQPNQPSIPSVPSVPSKKTKPIKYKTVYLVVNKNSQLPLGIYDTLELAKLNGQGSTYYNCIIYKYNINDKCTFMKNPVHEDA